MTDDKFVDLKKVLPSNPNILQKRKYFNSAVLVPIIKVNDEYNLLFELRAKGINQEGEICFPGGGFEKNKDFSFKDTAIRETVEELGIKKEDIEIIGSMDTLLTPYGVTVDSYVGYIHTDFNEIRNYDKKEVEEIFIVPVSFFVNNPPQLYKVNVEINPIETDKDGNKKLLLPVDELGLPKRYANIWNVYKHDVYVYKWKNYAIWGITANIINELVYLVTSDEL